MTLSQCAAKLAGDRTLTEQAITATLKEFADTLSVELDGTVEALNRLSHRDGYWSFTLPGGLTARVKFSADPERRHIEAFRKVFVTMVDVWLETEA